MSTPEAALAAALRDHDMTGADSVVQVRHGRGHEDTCADRILAALSPAQRLAIAGITEERLAGILMEYDAGRLVVEFEPGEAVPPGGKATRFHRAWATAILAALQETP